jgi:hypothetical protein
MVMSWWIVLIIAFGCFYLGFFFAALLAAGKDDRENREGKL